MPASRHPRPRALLSLTGLGVLALSTALLAAPAGATAGTATTDTPVVIGSDTVTDTTDSPEIGPRVERACLRIPNLELRTERLIVRLDGDASVRGSLAWLADRAEAAREAGRDQRAEVLENRVAVRTATRDVLDVRLDDLTRLRSRCEELGVL
jgi:hypothetical protein